MMYIGYSIITDRCYSLNDLNHAVSLAEDPDFLVYEAEVGDYFRDAHYNGSIPCGVCYALVGYMDRVGHLEWHITRGSL